MNIRKLISCVVTAALIVVSPGPACYELFAQTVRGAAPLAEPGAGGQAGARPLGGLSSPLYSNAPVLTAGGLKSAIPVLAGPKAVAHAASVAPQFSLTAPKVQAITPQARDQAQAQAAPGTIERLAAVGAESVKLSGTLEKAPEGQAKERADFVNPVRVGVSAAAVDLQTPAESPRFGDLRPAAGAIPALSAPVPQAAPTETKPTASLFSRGVSAVKGFAANVRELLGGEKKLAYIIAGREKQLKQTRRLMILDGVLGIVITLAVGPLLDLARTVGPATLALNWPTLAIYSGVILAAFIASVFVERKHVLMKRTLGLFAARDYRVELDRSLLSQEMDFHQEKENSSAALAKRILGDTNYLSNKNVDSRLSAAYSGVFLVFGAAMMLWIHLPMALAVLAVIPVLGILNGKFGEKMVRLHFAQSDTQAEVMRQGQEALSQVQTVKSFGTAETEIGRFSQRADALRDIAQDNARVSANYAMFANALMSFFTKYLIYIAGGFLAAVGGLSLGHVIQMSLFAGFAGAGFTGVSEAYLNFKRNQGSSKIVRELLIREPKISDAKDAQAVAKVDGAIRFEDVSFSYGSRPIDGKVIDGLTFEAKPGETIAFVGETGSGKSTVAKLILRLWDPSSGKVTIDGQDLKSLQRQSFLKHVAVVPQDTKLFNNTIRYNMTYGVENVSDERLEKAIRMARAEFVFNKALFPKGLETPVAEAGDRLSGGEQQRIAIVRAMLRGPAILILDEATSALDNESEKIVQAGLNSLTAGEGGRKPTTIVVAHRLTTVQNADRIVVLDKGKILETGTHAELLAKGGRYAELWKKGGYGEPAAATPAPVAAPAKAPEAAAPAAVARVEAAPEAAAPAAVARVEAAPEAAPVKKNWAVRAYESITNFLFGDKVLKPMLRKYRWQILGASALLVVDALFWIGSSHFVGQFLDLAEAAAKAGLPAFKTAMLHSAGWIVGIAVALTGLDWLTTWLTAKLQAQVVRDVRVSLMRKLFGREMSFHKDHSSGELASRVMEDGESLAKKNVAVRLPLIKNLISLVLSAGLMLHTNLLMGLAVLGVMPVLGIVNGYFGHKTESMYIEFGKRRAEYGRTSQEVLENIQTVKMMGQEKAEVERNGQRANAVAESGVPGAYAMANAQALSSSLTDFFTRHALYIGGAWAVALALGMTFGHIVAMTLFAGFIKASFDGLSAAWMEYKQEHGETEVIRDWLAQPSKIEDAPDAKPLPPVKGAISFENLNFRYSDDGQAAGGLSDFNLSIAPGETVAFVGRTGAGKSTILKLVQRLWDPQSGKIAIDGHDIKSVTLNSLSHNIAVVPQRPSLFNDTVRYNMLYGSEGATEAELMAAIKAARADFVFDKRAFPDGLDTRVGEGGGQLSGGQAQRVAIVRAILKKPRILILDEATSKLDKQTEKEIQETLESLSRGEAGVAKPTTLVVAHNLTTIMGADRIVVLDNGRVADSGTHAELLSREGLYRTLWRAAQSDPTAQ